MAVTDWSTTPANNTSISGMNIAENCPAGNINGGMRQMMADIKVAFEGVPSSATLMPKEGGTFAGTQPKYSGRGAYLHHSGSGYTSGRIFIQAAGGSTPAGMASGDFLAEY